jgi:hypothetical protein
MSTINTSGLKNKIKKSLQLKPTVTQQAFDYFKTITPERKGNAKANTRLTNNVIEAAYPYASVLDGGRRRVNGRMQGSTQAPNGMSKPTIKQFKKFVNDFLIKIG